MAYELTYSLINNDTEYSVIGYTGDPVDVVIPSDYNGLPITSIGDSAFYTCKSLTSIIIPDSVTSIGSYAFYNCKSLTSIIIPDSVVSLPGGVFGGCPIEKATIPAFASSYIIPSALKEVVITSGVSIPSEAFNVCTKLTSVTIPASVTSIGSSAFQHCSSLTEIVIPDSVTSIGDTVFLGCSSLTEIVIPDSVTSIGDRVFVRCSNLRYNVKGELNYLGNENNPYLYLAGRISDDITNAIIDENCRLIGYNALYGCSSLTSVVIPDSVTSISGSAFSGHSNLTKVTLLAKTPASLLGSKAFSSNSIFYCFSDAIEAYKTASNWNTYADQFIADDMRLCFTMNANAQKKYFASKEYVDRPAIEIAITGSGSNFQMDVNNMKSGHVYMLTCMATYGESIMEADNVVDYFFSGQVLFKMPEKIDSKHMYITVPARYYTYHHNGDASRVYPNASITVHLSWTGGFVELWTANEIILSSGDSSKAVRVDVSELQLVEVR